MAAKPISIEKREQTPQLSIAETALLCSLLIAGLAFSVFSITKTIRGTQFMILAAAEAAVLACAAVGILIPKKQIGFLAGFIGTLATMIFMGPEHLLSGMKLFANCYISGWNIQYEDNVRLFSSENAERWHMNLFFLALLFLITGLFWYLIRHRKFFGTQLLLAFLYLPQLVLKNYSSFGAVFVLSAIIGFWLFTYQAGSVLRRFIWMGSIMCILFALMIVSGKRTSWSFLQLRHLAAEQINAFLYGEDTLPDGDLIKAAGMEEGDEIRLSVSTEQVKSLYLRSYTGAEYSDGKWEPLKRAAYGGDRYGFLKWLKKQDFDPNAQFAAYIQAGNAALPENEYVEANHVGITNQLANRKRIYTLYSSETPQTAAVRQNRDNGYEVWSIFGLRKYQLTEYSSNLPGELQRLNEWVYDPSDDAQNQYLDSEAVYRSFVHENYLTVDEHYASLINNLFHESDKHDVTGQMGVYEVSKRIRSILETNTHYTSKKALLDLETPENEDLLTAFLRGHHDGNSAYYATAAVLAFRSFQIPARYAEGYYLNSQSIERSGTSPVPLLSSDSHAWAEVYMDGMGWVPVDVTPGFYYDTYALLQMAQVPGTVQKTAALEDSGEEADNPDSLTAGKRPPSPVVTQLKLIGNIIWGAGLIVIFIAGLGILALELRHLLNERRMLGIVDLPAERRADMLFKSIRHSLFFFGLEVNPGWNCEETEKRLQKLFTGYQNGSYVRVNELMEKYYYGGEDLKEHELRTLFLFLQTIRENRKNLSAADRLRMRYDL